MTSDGVTVALMGIDGCGKTTLAGQLRATLGAAGLEVVDPGLTTALSRTGLPAGYPRSSLELLALEAWRLFYAGGTVDGRPAEDAVSSAFASSGLAGMGADLPAGPAGVRQPGVVVSALVEFAGHYLLRAEVIRPALLRGAVCVSDSFPLKNVVRTLRLAQRMPDPAVPSGALDTLVDAVRAAYSDAYLQPDVGILLDADPELAYRWRVSQTGRVEPGADLGLTGQTGPESYLRFQTVMADEYRTAAREWGWHVLPVDGRPQRRTLDAAVDIVLNHPRLRRRVRPGGEAGADGGLTATAPDPDS
ncbi:nucleoside/nucleotide kinase family protein [Plantactinospora endophytica]|uniref:Thymidylate kinase n=1 Tax=Plantactinospora endophytica TaxID=673535 RepID=A0ABQ4EBR2_9ACTN|nr:hypothetical protein [Plantactinospora endophytica]GIG92090.1 hypothetical protein Pen02_70260 [Plantactinospora endophytica]